MRFTALSVNVGAGAGNRAVVMDVFSFVGFLFVIDSPLAGGKHVPQEPGSWELLSFCEDSGVEVYVHLGLCYAHVNSSPLLVRGSVTNRKNVCPNSNAHEKYVRSEASVAATQDTERVHVPRSQLLIGTI